MCESVSMEKHLVSVLCSDVAGSRDDSVAEIWVCVVDRQIFFVVSEADVFVGVTVKQENLGYVFGV